MALQLPEPRFMPCSRCGAAVERGKRDNHVCSRARLVEFQMFHVRHELAALDAEVTAYFKTPQGRFELWLAEREREGR
jgi:hypothetical protein